MKKRLVFVPQPYPFSTWEEMIVKYIPAGWKEIFDQTTDERKDIVKIMKEKVFPKTQNLLPKKENLFRAFDLIKPNEVRVVIVGQDPYPTPGKAQGLAFSIAKNDRDLPPTLKNIYKSIKNSYPEFVIPHHGDLTPWVKQGVLLLNMALTFPVKGKPGDHLRIWRSFTVKTVRELANRYPDIIFVLWGNEAKTLQEEVNISLTSSHPSPNAVQRGGDFLMNNHFRKINEILEEQGREPIDWQI